MIIEYLTRIMDYEEGTLAPAEVIQLFQDLVDTGDIWRLRDPHYRRAAQQLIQLGMIYEGDAK